MQMIDEVRKSAYAEYKTTEIDTRALPYLRRLVKRHFPRESSAKILDLGCGKGALLLICRELGYTACSGVDISVSQVNVCVDRNLRVEAMDCFAALERMPSSALDVVVTFDLIEHLTKAELLVLGNDIYRALMPGGRWIIHTANAEGPFGSRIRFADLTHEQAFTTESIEQLRGLVGFSDVHFEEDRPVPHGFASVCRAIAWLALRSMLLAFYLIETGAAKKRILTQNLLAILEK